MKIIAAARNVEKVVAGGVARTAAIAITSRCNKFLTSHVNLPIRPIGKK
jgi:hypothetical protein